MNIPAWFAFNSKDGVNVVSGDSLTDCVAIADSCDKVVAVGINCTPPRFIHDLILSAAKVCLQYFFFLNTSSYFSNKFVLMYWLFLRPGYKETNSYLSEQWRKLRC